MRSNQDKDKDDVINPWEKNNRRKKLLLGHPTTRDRIYTYLMQLKVTDFRVLCREPYLSCKQDGMNNTVDSRLLIRSGDVLHDIDYDWESVFGTHQRKFWEQPVNRIVQFG